ncbi:hypothetical protein BUALT_Bualt02G0156200 [Buddleja alternifolia]|uniref:Uncharacterized protein n=1 Tax=Buddleja alternifolia TaxID=168488 RepID=A0AAV6YBA8_9LAMI|nr:hypothetical protein BUALT_Bualt02G0156200 [Buddleja alternifolia]
MASQSNDPRLPSAARPFKPPLIAPQDLPVDYSGFIAVIFGVFGAMFRYKICSWLAIIFSAQSLANMRNMENDLKQISMAVIPLLSHWDMLLLKVWYYGVGVELHGVGASAKPKKLASSVFESFGAEAFRSWSLEGAIFDVSYDLWWKFGMLMFQLCYRSFAKYLPQELEYNKASFGRGHGIVDNNTSVIIYQKDAVVEGSGGGDGGDGGIRVGGLVLVVVVEERVWKRTVWVWPETARGLPEAKVTRAEPVIRRER